jgi:hypothetical protein
MPIRMRSLCVFRAQANDSGAGNANIPQILCKNVNSFTEKLVDLRQPPG